MKPPYRTSFAILAFTIAALPSALVLPGLMLGQVTTEAQQTRTFYRPGEVKQIPTDAPVDALASSASSSLNSSATSLQGAADVRSQSSASSEASELDALKPAAPEEPVSGSAERSGGIVSVLINYGSGVLAVILGIGVTLFLLRRKKGLSSATESAMPVVNASEPAPRATTNPDTGNQAESQS